MAVAPELDRLDQALDALVALGPESLGDPASVELLERALGRLSALTTTAVGSFDASGAWADDGAKGAVPWIATRGRLPRSEARRQVALARKLRGGPKVARAWLDGDLGTAQASLLGALVRERTGAAFERDEALLVDQASKLRFDDFVRATRYWEQLADPEGVEDDAESRRARRAVFLDQSMDGVWLGSMTLDPISGAIVAGELERLEQELFESDWARAKERLGRDPKPDELARTGAPRRADALVEMAKRSRAMPKGARKPAPLFSVFVGYESLQGRILELAQGMVVAPGDLVPWLSHAEIERAVFTPEGRVECSETSRFFVGATRRAIELRDRRCQHPLCDRPATRCQADHIVEFTKGGPTTQDNGRLLCGFHNRLRNRRDWDEEGEGP